jgi:hypothetical protein
MKIPVIITIMGIMLSSVVLGSGYFVTTLDPLTFSVNVNEKSYSDLIIPIDLTNEVTREIAEVMVYKVFRHVKGKTAFFYFNALAFSNKEIVASLNWGLNELEINHVFELTVDLDNLQIEVTHCF